jgi:hypothetical protein
MFGVIDGPAVIKRREKDLPVKKEFRYNPIRSFRDVNPYDMAFCYPHPLYDKPFIVKGGHQDVREYLKFLNIPIIAHHTLYRKKSHRTVYGLYCIDKNIQIRRDYRWEEETRKYRKATRYNLLLHKKNMHGFMEKVKVLATLKRIPRRWIRELNLYVTTERRSFHGSRRS